MRWHSKSVSAFFPLSPWLGGHDWHSVDGGQSFMCGVQDWAMKNYPAQRPVAPCGEISSGIETLRRAMILPLPQSSLVAELGFIHKSEQEMCQESTLFCFPLPTANILQRKPKNQKSISPSKNPAIYKKNPWVLGLLHHQIRREERSILPTGKLGGI